MEHTIEVKGLSKRFTMHILNDKVIHAIQNLDFFIKEGEIVGLAGKSGAGKSTLIKCIYRTCIPSKGEIIYNSKKFGKIDLAKADDYEILALRKSEMTYCSQFLSVIPRVTAIDVVAVSLVSKGESWGNARQIAKEYLSKLGLDEELWDAYPSTFSGGEQQRINVARAIISKPHFLLIDEPTASLDQKTKDIVINMVLDLKNQGTSVLCITHDPYTMEHIADRVIELKDGKIVEPALS
ncbi:MAG: ATP-binding cassette domain-containing protein [Bacteroidota bacterium]|nr:ATP-binding cassette domain-containing protein [uncultured Allomuricauda sp.]